MESLKLAPEMTKPSAAVKLARSMLVKPDLAEDDIGPVGAERAEGEIVDAVAVEIAQAGDVGGDSWFGPPPSIVKPLAGSKASGRCRRSRFLAEDHPGAVARSRRR